MADGPIGPPIADEPRYDDVFGGPSLSRDTSPRAVGRLTRTSHDKFISDLVSWEAFALGQLSTLFQETNTYWRIWQADHDDPRSPEERQWRANIHPPSLFVTGESAVSIIVDIINGIDPPIQASERGPEDTDDAIAIEKYLDYVLEMNSWRGLFAQEVVRSAKVQGMDFIQVTHIDRRRTIRAIPTSKQKDEFQEALIRARSLGAPDFPNPAIDPVSFDAWRQLANEAHPQAKVPEPPYGGREDIIHYRGPHLMRIPIYQMRWDPQAAINPLVGWAEGQHTIIRRVVKPRGWVDRRTGRDPDKPFDPAQVERARAGGYQEKFSSYENEFAGRAGITPSSDADPLTVDKDELWEVWRVGGDLDDDEVKYAIVMNQSEVINKNPHETPFADGECHILPIRNMVVPDLAIGMSDYKQSKSVYDEQVRYRNLVQDASTLGVIPVFAKLRELGISELQRQVAPGRFWSVPRLDAIKKAWEVGLPSEVFQVLGLTDAEIARASSIYTHVEGQPASIGRVPATESSSRLNQALIRLKLSALTYEAGLQPLVPQALTIAYQFGPERVVEEIGKRNPFLRLDRSRFLEALHGDFKFRGATQAINRELMAQMTSQWLEKHASQLTAEELRVGMKEIADTLGLRRANQLVSAKGTAALVKMWELNQQIAQMTLEQKLAQLTLPQPPTDVPPDVAQALAGELPGQPGQPTPSQPAQPAQPPQPAQSAQPAPPVVPGGGDGGTV
jgi:hypothetical protein